MSYLLATFFQGGFFLPPARRAAARTSRRPRAAPPHAPPHAPPLIEEIRTFIEEIRVFVEKNLTKKNIAVPLSRNRERESNGFWGVAAS